MLKCINSDTSTYAVVIGISDYQDDKIPDLNFAHPDAGGFANFLRSPAILIFLQNLDDLTFRGLAFWEGPN